MADVHRVHLKIEGDVQGVGFRYATQLEARTLALSGWVRNRDDGGVEIIAEGPKEALEALEKWCAKGPPSAEVRSVQVTRGAATGEFEGFSVRR